MTEIQKQIIQQKKFYCKDESSLAKDKLLLPLALICIQNDKCIFSSADRCHHSAICETK